MMRKILLFIVIWMTLVIVAGIYRFNFTQDNTSDTQHYVRGDVRDDVRGEVDVQFDSDNVMLTLLSFQTDNLWEIDLPESDTKVALTKVTTIGERHLATGQYRNGAEHGVVGVDFYKIIPLNLPSSDNEMVFIVPFSVSNQGSGVFWYLGLFLLNSDTAEIKQTDTTFIGDRIQIQTLHIDEPFDVTSSIVVSYLQRGQSQSMVEPPKELIEKRIRVSAQGFSI
ncbi:hypothetical protein [Shewanella psychrotolerans]|uniref:hypothetical protein n=1 Tax=Shewanella psychrotolerans TaxID=2864206 RepID=UPI001C65F728|nr:hypothetical protein [Shewanella psychrotolerans]QYK00576.1 hypothetical protein K0I62_14385 [Shewanella psychrotolerans]